MPSPTPTSIRLATGIDPTFVVGEDEGAWERVQTNYLSLCRTLLETLFPGAEVSVSPAPDGLGESWEVTSEEAGAQVGDFMGEEPGPLSEVRDHFRSVLEDILDDHMQELEDPDFKPYVYVM